MNVNWTTARRLRARVARLEAALQSAQDARGALMVAMEDSGMGRSR